MGDIIYEKLFHHLLFGIITLVFFFWYITVLVRSFEVGV